MGAESRSRFAAFWERLRGGADTGKRYAEIGEDLVADTVERAINGTDEKIRLVPGYRKRLKPATAAALIYADRLVDEIPAPIDISCRDFSANPYVNAFFASARDIAEAVYNSSEVRDYCREWTSSGRDECYALICMRMVEKQMFGMDLVGNDLVRDVPQTSVTFRDHRIYSPAPSEPRARLALRCCLLDGLIEHALADITALRATRRHLEIEQRRLLARSRQAGARSAPGADREILGRLEEVRGKLDGIGHITPETCLEQLLRILGAPDRFVRLRRISLDVDRMGIKVTTDSQRTGTRLELAEAEMGGQTSRVVILGRLRRSEVIPPGGIPDRHHRLRGAVRV